MTDVFTAACPQYRAAMSKAAKPLPILAGEVAEYPRPASFAVSVLKCIPVAAVLIVLIAAVCSLIVAVMP